VTDESALLFAFLAAAINKDSDRMAYLRRFIMANAQELGKEARAVEDSAKLNATIPGVLFQDRDAV
jgi:hypothetical protein